MEPIEPAGHGKFQFLTESFILVALVFLLLDEFSEFFDGYRVSVTEINLQSDKLINN